MKCPVCGTVNPPQRKQCIQCATVFSRDSAPPPSARKGQVAATAPEAPVPDWRQEVHKKAREYGERKKRLTTPPEAWEKHSGEEAPAERRPAIDTPAALRAPSTEPVVPPPQVMPSRPAVTAEHTPLPAPLEVWQADLSGLSEADEEQSPPRIHLGSRLFALITDSTILIVTFLTLLALISWATGDTMMELVREQWTIVVPLAALGHLSYYLYFYRVSRQTPGLVFASLELRDPDSSEIPTEKILTRWVAMVVLNVFNLAPALFGRKWLLLDRLSKTEIRSFK